MIVLGIETSCDETGVALYDGQREQLIAHLLHSQTALHAAYGGVVPELASRDHIRRLPLLVRRLLDEARIKAPDGVAWTAGPGLIGALLAGAAVGRSLAWGWDVPGVAVHHMEGHLLAPLLEGAAPAVPFLALLVSGGHTLLTRVDGVGRYALLGESLDDAAGEAFDKTAKLLGLGYPGGPALARLAEQGDARRFRFPRPMTNRPGLDFGFSGLKTSVANTLRAVAVDGEVDGETRAAIARAFEEAVADTLAIKCRRALRMTGLTRLAAAGGVSANRRIRARLHEMAKAEGARVYFPRPLFCTDNGAMIAYAGWRRLQAGERAPLTIEGRARWPLTELMPID